MSAVSGTLGSKLFVSTSAIASTIDTEAEFSAQTWQEVGLIESFGEFGRNFDLVTFQAVADGRMYKLKGGYNDGNIQFTIGQDLSDAGQLIMNTAANLSTQDNYGIRIEMNDRPSTIGGPSIFFFRGLVMSYRTQMGAVNTVVRATSSVEINSTILHAGPAIIYDLFTTGESLSSYHLFNGSDAEAVDPVISANALVLVSGDASDGSDAKNVSQIITDTGTTLATGNVTLEALFKISAITNVKVFFGLTDQKASLEIPIESASSANTITTNATDGVGFMFDTNMGTDNWWLVGVNNDVDETAQNVGSAPVAATYYHLRIELNTSGDASFYIDGTLVGSVMTTACRTSVNLYPTIVVSSTNTATRTGTADYLYFRQDV